MCVVYHDSERLGALVTVSRRSLYRVTIRKRIRHRLPQRLRWKAL